MNKNKVLKEVMKTIKMSRKQADRDQSWEGLINSATLLIELYDKIEELELPNKPTVGFHSKDVIKNEQ
jgi:hypothetical protein